MRSIKGRRSAGACGANAPRALRGPFRERRDLRRYARGLAASGVRASLESGQRGERAAALGHELHDPLGQPRLVAGGEQVLEPADRIAHPLRVERLGARTARTIRSALVGCARSSALKSSSRSFSPGRGPVNSIAMSTSGS